MRCALPMWLFLACGTGRPGAGPGRDGPGSDSGSTTPIQDPSLDALRAALEADGFVVQEGRPGFLPVETCCDWISCFKWNPSSHYGLWFLPLSPEEPLEGRDVDEDGLAWHWRLRSDEAVLFVGNTPPPVQYHSYRSYVHERWDAALGLRVPGFRSLGDSLNQVVLGHEGEEPFNALTVVITAADRGIDARVRAAAVRSGVHDDWINTDIVPPSLVELGLHDEADTIRMNHRVALFEEVADRDAWLADPDGTVWRLTPREPAEVDPFPPPTFLAGGTGTSEAWLQPAVDALREAILAAHADSSAVEATVNLREPDPNEDCWNGCNRDASQSNTPQFSLPDDPGHFVVVYGVNHRATGKAGYHNAIVFGVDNDDPGAWVDDPDMPGSARDYLPDHPDADLLYAWTFARDCAGRAHCSEVQKGCPGVEEGEPAAIHWRAYLDPSTGTHPLAEELVVDGAIRFSPP